MTARSGVLVVDKAAGPTSFDVVTLVRRHLGARRVGHAGTLDPDALGVLPILIGEATKLQPYLGERDKEYVATIRFGVTTDTEDVSGRVLATAPVPALTVAQLERAARAFVGRIAQVPPMYSAVHLGGRRLYELARRGEQVERAPREVVVHAIAVEDVQMPLARLRIVCGKGTYVRTIAADLGRAVGCGAALERLVRTQVGPFTRADALPSGEILTTPAEALWRRVQPPEVALAGLPSIRLDEPAAARFVHGQSVEVVGLSPEQPCVAVHLAGGPLLGVGEPSADGVRLKPARILHADHPGPRVLPA
jgi:tRNA pseudouridine55 synthase